MEEVAKTTEGLKTKLVSKITEQLDKENKNIQLLDVLNRLLGTVNNCIVSEKANQ